MKGGEFSEKDWPENEDELDAYAKSKTKAEKEAWEFVKNLEGRYQLFHSTMVYKFINVGEQQDCMCDIGKALSINFLFLNKTQCGNKEVFGIM